MMNNRFQTYDTGTNKTDSLQKSWRSGDSTHKPSDATPLPNSSHRSKNIGYSHENPIGNLYSNSSVGDKWGTHSLWQPKGHVNISNRKSSRHNSSSSSLGNAAIQLTSSSNFYSDPSRDENIRRADAISTKNAHQTLSLFDDHFSSLLNTYDNSVSKRPSHTPPVTASSNLTSNGTKHQINKRLGVNESFSFGGTSSNFYSSMPSSSSVPISSSIQSGLNATSPIPTSNLLNHHPPFPVRSVSNGTGAMGPSIVAASSNVLNRSVQNGINTGNALGHSNTDSLLHSSNAGSVSSSRFHGGGLIQTSSSNTNSNSSNNNTAVQVHTCGPIVDQQGPYLDSSEGSQLILVLGNQSSQPALASSAGKLDLFTSSKHHSSKLTPLTLVGGSLTSEISKINSSSSHSQNEKQLSIASSYPFSPFSSWARLSMLTELLSKPLTQEFSSCEFSIGSCVYQIETATITNEPFRSQNEDEFIFAPISKSDVLVGVLDGHGGKECSSYLKKNFSNVFRLENDRVTALMQQQQQQPIGMSGSSTNFLVPNTSSNGVNYPLIRPAPRKTLSAMPDGSGGTLRRTGIALEKTFLRLDDQTRAVGCFDNGSTATVAALRHDESTDSVLAILANVGDSRAIVIDKNFQVSRLSYDHKAADTEETKRVMRNKGVVVQGRVSGQLAISRALGDHSLKSSGVSAIPSLYARAIELEEDRYIILASDGLWDVVEDTEVASFVELIAAVRYLKNIGCNLYLQNVRIDPMNDALNKNQIDCLIARLLVKWAIHQRSRDNTTVVVIKCRDENAKGVNPLEIIQLANK